MMEFNPEDMGFRFVNPDRYELVLNKITFILLDNLDLTFHIENETRFYTPFIGSFSVDNSDEFIQRLIYYEKHLSYCAVAKQAVHCISTYLVTYKRRKTIAKIL